MNMKIEPPPPYDNLKDLFKLAILPLLYVIGIWFCIGFVISLIDWLQNLRCLNKSTCLTSNLTVVLLMATPEVYLMDKFKTFRLVFGMIIVGALFCTALVGAYDLWIQPEPLVGIQ